MAADHLIDILDSLPGIQRDGTKFDSNQYIDGQWVRFYRGKPKKIGGQLLLDSGTNEIIRNVYNVDQQDERTDCYLGRPSSLNFTPITNSVANPEVDRTPTGFVTNPNNNWTFDRYTVLGQTNEVVLMPNILYTTNGSATVQVNFPYSPSLANGQYVTIFGAAATNGITADQLNISAQITFTPGNNYFTYTSGGVATSTGFGGGNNIAYVPNLANNPLTTVASSNAVTVTVTSTANLFEGETITINGATGFNGLTAEQLNTTTTILTILSPTTFVYLVEGVAASGSGAGGGTGVSLITSQTINYLIAHAAPNVLDINSSTQTLIYWGDTESTTPLVPISISNPVASGGIVVLYPYLFKYTNDGVVTWTLDPGGNWSDAVSAPIAGTKIVKGLRTRGGSNSPSGLFWTLNSLIRATFVGGNEVFRFDTIQDDISLLAQNSVVTQNNIFYWIGHNQFYVYNGIIRILPNDTNKVTFFQNLNWNYRNKVWGIYKEEYHEIWWYYPSGSNTECSDVLIYNIDGQFWFDSVHARSAGTTTGLYQYPLEADANGILSEAFPTVDVGPLGANPIATVSGQNVVKVTIPTNTILRTGMLVTITGATGFNGLSASQLNLVNVPITVLSNTLIQYTVPINATGTGVGGGAFVHYSYPNLQYGLWQEEYGTDKIINGNTYAIPSFFETRIMTWFEKYPSDDREMRLRRIEPDFVMKNNMTMTINTRDFAQGPISTSQVYMFTPESPIIEMNKIDTNNMGRLVSFRFESNISEGTYLAGKIVLNYAPGDVRP